MPGDRDLFANFERMRREMDELFGDVLDRSGLACIEPSLSIPERLAERPPFPARNDRHRSQSGCLAK